MHYTEIYFVILQKETSCHISETIFSYFRGQKHKHHHHLCTNSLNECQLSCGCQISNDAAPQAEPYF